MQKENIEKTNKANQKPDPNADNILLSPEFLKNFYHSHHRDQKRNEKMKEYRRKREEKARATSSTPDISEESPRSSISTESGRRRRDRLVIEGGVIV